MRGQGSVHSSHGPYSLGQSSPPRPWGQWVPGCIPRGPQLCGGRNRPGLPTAPLEGVHGAGESQGLSASTTPAPGLSCTLAPILPRQHSYFYSLQFSVNSPCVCVWREGGRAWDSQRSGWGSRSPLGSGDGRGAVVPLKGQAAPCPLQASLPSAGRPSRNAQCKTHKSHQTPLCF